MSSVCFIMGSVCVVGIVNHCIPFKVSVQGFTVGSRLGCSYKNISCYSLDDTIEKRHVTVKGL